MEICVSFPVVLRISAFVSFLHASIVRLFIAGRRYNVYIMKIYLQIIKYLIQLINDYEDACIFAVHYRTKGSLTFASRLESRSAVRSWLTTASLWTIKWYGETNQMNYNPVTQLPWLVQYSNIVWRTESGTQLKWVVLQILHWLLPSGRANLRSSFHNPTLILGHYHQSD